MGEFLKEQVADSESKAAIQVAGHLASCYSYYCDFILIKTAPIGGGLQNDVPVTLLACILYLSHYPTSAVHLKNRLGMTRCDNIFMGRTWRMMCTDRFANGAHVPRMDLK